MPGVWGNPYSISRTAHLQPWPAVKQMQPFWHYLWGGHTFLSWEISTVILLSTLTGLALTTSVICCLFPCFLKITLFPVSAPGGFLILIQSPTFNTIYCNWYFAVSLYCQSHLYLMSHWVTATSSVFKRCLDLCFVDSVSGSPNSTKYIQIVIQ